MNKAGRIILLVVGIILIIFAIPSIISTCKEINERGWNDFASIIEKGEILVKLILNGIYIPFGLYAIIASVRGKISIKLIVFAVVCLAAIVFYFITAIQARAFNNIWSIITFFTGVLLCGGYITGTIFLIIDKKE